MIHPHTRLGPVDDHIGVGVFATHFIPRGTVVWVRDPWDRTLPPCVSVPDLYRAFVQRYAYGEPDGEPPVPRRSLAR